MYGKRDTISAGKSTRSPPVCYGIVETGTLRCWMFAYITFIYRSPQYFAWTVMFEMSLSWMCTGLMFSVGDKLQTYFRCVYIMTFARGPKRGSGVTSGDVSRKPRCASMAWREDREWSSVMRQKLFSYSRRSSDADVSLGRLFRRYVRLIRLRSGNECGFLGGHDEIVACVDDMPSKRYLFKSRGMIMSLCIRIVNRYL